MTKKLLTLVIFFFLLENTKAATPVLNETTIWDYVLSSFTLGPIIVSLIKGIVVSFFVILILFRLRPHIDISPKIARKINDNGSVYYIIKVINKSRLFKLYDVQVELVAAISEGASGGTNLRFKKLHFIKDNIIYINRMPYSKKEDPHATYAILFTCTDNVENELNNNYPLHFKVLAKHGLSSFPKIKTQHYHHNTEIVTGNFKFGNSFKIVC